jgi:hypothetical protein
MVMGKSSGSGSAGVGGGRYAGGIKAAPGNQWMALAVFSEICCTAAFITSADYQFAGISANSDTRIK